MFRSWVLALVFAVALAAWSLLAHPERLESVHAAGGVLVAIIGFLTAAALGKSRPWLPGLVTALAVGLAVLDALPDSLSGQPLAPPLGYGNADGMLLLCAVLGLLVSAPSIDRRWRLAMLAGAVLCTAACVAIHAQAAAACAAASLIWYSLRKHWLATVWGAGSAGVLCLAFGLTVALAKGVMTDSGPLVAALSRDRFRVWHDALHILGHHLVTGSGPGTFARLSPTARADHDLAWTHSAPLQFAAELGLVGLILFAGLVGETLLMLGRQAPVAAFLLLPATIDYVLDFGWVVLAVSAVVGAAYSAAMGKPWLTPPSP